MAELFVANGISGGTVFFLPSGPTVVGRISDCQIQIADPWISSLHARFERRGDSLWIVDLASRNGTFVNDARVSESAVRAGDRIRFGKTDTELRQARAPSLISPRSDITVVHELGKEPARTLVGNDLAIVTARRQVVVLNEIGKALVDAPDVKVALEKILRIAASAVHARSSVLMLLDDAGQMQSRGTYPNDVPFQISPELVATATQRRSGLVAIDRIEVPGAVSVAIEARSMLVAPLWAENRILGTLAMERPATDAFSEDELDLVTAVGYQAALAVERARFIEQVRAVDEQRRKLMRHFSPDVASLILSSEQLDKDPLEVKVRENVTVLFSDVQGFTGLTERLPALELAALLRDYFRSMTEAIFAQGGTLDKFIGDGLMAVFGAPVRHGDDSLRAVRCAWDMLERVRTLNQTLPDDRQLHVRIGVNTGRVMAGNFGSADRLEFTVLGDTVNIASRLESIAPPDSVLVGAVTAEEVRPTFVLEALGSKQLKGKSATIEVFKVRGLR